jgi:DUF4097 and DUF4098 domain-containing protein YvlB
MKTEAIKHNIVDTKALLRFTFFAGIFIVLLTTALLAQNQRDAYQIEKIDVSNSPEIVARTSGGHIEVYGGNGDKVEIQVYVKKNGNYLSSSDYDLSDDYSFTIEQSGNTIEVSAKRLKDGWGGWMNKIPSVSYIIKVPTNSQLDLKTSGGHIDVAMIEGEIAMNTSGGHLNIKEVNGIVDARTSGGHINLTAIKGSADVRTSGGHIDLKEAEGMFELRTSGGHIDIDELYGSVNASTSGGSVRASMEVLTGNVQLRTSGGSVSLSMPSSEGADLEIRGTRVRANLVNFSGSQTKSSISGTINGGGYKVSLRTSGGTAKLDLRD